MPVYECKYYVLVRRTVTAPSTADAVKWAKQFVGPGDLLLGATRVDPPLPPEEPEPVKPLKPLPPTNRPGGTPGTPTLPKVVITEAVAA